MCKLLRLQEGWLFDRVLAQFRGTLLLEHQILVHLRCFVIVGHELRTPPEVDINPHIATAARLEPL